MTTNSCFVILVANGQNIDERLRAARERREEQQKALGMLRPFMALLTHCPRFSRQITVRYWLICLYSLTVLPQPPGSWAELSGSSGPGGTLNSSCSNARRNSWSTGSKRRGGVLLWRRSASSDWKRRKWVLFGSQKQLFLVRVMLSQSWIE